MSAGYAVIVLNEYLEDLAQILFDAIESPAAAFKARGIPEALRVVEVMGITQARKWRVCTVIGQHIGCCLSLLIYTI